MAKKLRVFQVARELSLSNEAVIVFLGKKDKTIKNQMSAVPVELYDEIRLEYSKNDSSADDQQDFRQQLKEKQMLEELRRNKARMELEERIKFATKVATERPQRLKKKELLKNDLKTEGAAAVSEQLESEGSADAGMNLKDNSDIFAPENVDELSVVDIISKAKKEIDQKKKADTVSSKGKGSRQDPEVSSEKEPSAKKEEPGEKKTPVATRAETSNDRPVANIQKSSTSPKTKLESKSGQPKAATGSATVVKKGFPAAQDKKKFNKKKKRKVSEKEVQESIRQTLASMGDVRRGRRRRYKDSDEIGKDEAEFEELSKIKVSEFISAAELATQLNVSSGEIITVCLQLGLMVSINQRLDMSTIEAVADEFGFAVEKIEEYGSEILDKYEESEEDLKNAIARAPVVTIMGHVDHGKTSLLDYIRKSSITTGESGGITQHIGAYEVSVNQKNITFLDTPGHEAFTAMRARGAQVTDLVVLIVAADDGVQPQTIEAINHALAATVPIVVAINKIDKDGANIDFIKQQLSTHNVLVEEWGGKYQAVEISAKTGQGIDKLLELILLEAEVLELKANPVRTALGVIIESKLDRGKGPVGTVLIQGGTLNVGDLFVAGQHSGKVRAMYNERNVKVKQAFPSVPIQVIGFDSVPQAGDTFVVMNSEREVREISTKRQQLRREQDFRKRRHVSLDDISEQIKHGELRELNIILKADVDGSIEALSDALMKLSNSEVAVKVIHKAVGGISESDVLLASASNAVIMGFHVRPTIQARTLAAKEEIDIRLYDIIYSAVGDVRSALEGMLAPKITEELTATIEVREIFKVPKIGTIAGSYVLSGKASRNDFIRIYRDDKLLHETKLSSLRRFKEDMKEVASGFECGVGLENYDDVKIGDIIETYRKVETARSLD